MRYLALLIVLLVANCASKIDTLEPVVSPAITAPAKVDEPSADAIAEGASVVREQNRKLEAQVAGARTATASAQEKIKQLETKQRITAAEAKEVRDDLEQTERELASAVAQSVEQREQLDKLDAVIAEQQVKIALHVRRMQEMDASLVKANEMLSSMQALTGTLTREKQAIAAAKDQLEGRILEVEKQRNRWRLLAAALLIMVGAYVALKLYR